MRLFFGSLRVASLRCYFLFFDLFFFFFSSGRDPVFIFWPFLGWDWMGGAFLGYVFLTLLFRRRLFLYEFSCHDGFYAADGWASHDDDDDADADADD